MLYAGKVPVGRLKTHLEGTFWELGRSMQTHTRFFFTPLDSTPSLT